MSDSPQSAQKDVEQGVASPEDGDQQINMDNPSDPQGNASTQYSEFEVKEQDRWLPIANGKLLFPCVIVAFLSVGTPFVVTQFVGIALPLSE